MRSRFLAAACSILLCLLCQFEPVSGHAEKEHPAVRIGNALGKFDAIGGVQPVARDGF